MVSAGRLSSVKLQVDTQSCCSSDHHTDGCSHRGSEEYRTAAALLTVLFYNNNNYMDNNDNGQTEVKCVCHLYYSKRNIDVNRELDM